MLINTTMINKYIAIYMFLSKVLKQVVAEKSLTKNVYMYYIRVKEGKNENMKKKAK